MKKWTAFLLTLIFALGFCACTKQESAPTDKSATEQEAQTDAQADTQADTQEEAQADNDGGVVLLETKDLTEENAENKEPEEPLGEAFQTLEDSYTEHYNAIVAGITPYAASMMESSEGIAGAIGEVLLYMNTEETKAHIQALDDVIAKMETTAESDVEKEKIESDKKALQIFKDIRDAYENWDSLDDENKQMVMAYIMALAMSQTSAE